MWKTISSRNVWSDVLKNRKKNGQFYYAQTLITPISDPEGNICTFKAIRQDITDSIRQKTELVRTFDILNETSSIAKVGGWELEVETGELTWTDETFGILEVGKIDDQKPMLPEGIDLFIPEHQAVIETAVSWAIEFGEAYSLELQAQTAKENVLWLYTSGRANYQDGKVISLSCTIQDIDDRKQTEPPDIMFIDYRLADTSGDRVARKLDDSIEKILVTGELTLPDKSLFLENISKTL